MEIKLAKAGANISEINWIMMNCMYSAATSLQRWMSNEVGENNGKWLMLLKKHRHMHTFKYCCVPDSSEGPNLVFILVLALVLFRLQHVNVK